MTYETLPSDPKNVKKTNKIKGIETTYNEALEAHNQAIKSLKQQRKVAKREIHKHKQLIKAAKLTYKAGQL